jgi:hypothetical protein
LTLDSVISGPPKENGGSRIPIGDNHIGVDRNNGEVDSVEKGESVDQKKVWTNRRDELAHEPLDTEPSTCRALA